MTIHQLECFAAAFEEGGFKRATLRLGITQPALSYQIKLLEGELEVLLFHRKATGVSPTEAGRILYEHARRITHDLRMARRSLTELADTVAGEVRIGSVNSIGIYFLPTVLRSFRQKYPAAETKVLYRNSKEILEALHADAVDLAVVASPRTDRRLLTEPLITERVWLVCDRGHPLAARVSIKPSDLNGQRLVTLVTENPTGDLINSYLAQLGVTVEQVVSTDNVETARRMVEIGLGVSFLPDMLLQRRDDRLVRLDLSPPLTRCIALVTWRNIEPSRTVLAFIEELRAEAARIQTVPVRFEPKLDPANVG